jgi:adenylate cyclase
MALEIERKFLVRGETWREASSAVRIRQGYLSTDPDRVVRVRTRGGRGFLTVKGRARGATRVEVEVEVPLSDAEELLALCTGSIVEKTRHELSRGDFVWEIDEFWGDNAGLVVAELEVGADADFERALADPPDWLGQDVTDDVRLSNARLSERPFASWPDAERERYFLTNSTIKRG